MCLVPLGLPAAGRPLSPNQNILIVAKYGNAGRPAGRSARAPARLSGRQLAEPKRHCAEGRPSGRRAYSFKRRYRGPARKVHCKPPPQGVKWFDPTAGEQAEAAQAATIRTQIDRIYVYTKAASWSPGLGGQREPQSGLRSSYYSTALIAQHYSSADGRRPTRRALAEQIDSFGSDESRCLWRWPGHVGLGRDSAGRARDRWRAGRSLTAAAGTVVGRVHARAHTHTYAHTHTRTHKDAGRRLCCSMLSCRAGLCYGCRLSAT